MAWGVLGHRIVGEIADSYLTARAKKEIEKILGNESIAMASNWADFIKSDSSYAYLSPWHYVNLKAGLTKSELESYLAKDTATDAFTRLNFLVKQLKNKELSPENKLMYLRLLIHLVGDIHEPMHTGRSEDLGGNRVKLIWFNAPTNLHSIWDDQLIAFQQLSYTEYARAINHTTRLQRTTWQAPPVSQWFYESYQISERLYSEIRQPDEKLSYRYNFDHVQELNEQLLKGGVRLAGLLNDIFGH